MNTPMNLMMLEQEMGRLFNYWIDPMHAMKFMPSLDLEEKESHYLFRMDLPGLTPEDVKIEMTARKLKVHGERKENGNERIYEREITLPESIRTDQTEARLENGVLWISVPKAAPTARAWQVPISSGKESLLSRLTGKSEVSPKQTAPPDSSTGTAA